MFSILAQSMLTATRSDVPEEPRRCAPQTAPASCPAQPADQTAAKRAAG